MRLAFMGTPAFAVPALSELLAAGLEVAAVYTRAPQPAGRGQKLQPSPVHAFAEQQGLSVRTPRNFRAEEDAAAFEALALDAAIVVAYGVILPRRILEAPRFGCFNLHASLLPRWRGAAPIHRAVMAGDTETGVQVMRMEEGLDTGSILLSETTPIRADDTTATVHDRLSVIGASLLPRALAALERGGISETPQAEDGVTYAEKITSAEAEIDWSRPAREVDAHIRGLSPFPGAWFHASVGGTPRRVKALMSGLAESATVGEAGEILNIGDDVTVACGEGAVRLLRLQREGKAAQDAADFLRGAGWRVGDLLSRKIV
ncbi:MAG: methionyl-tRNA formyltransferase [Pseudomonadota bacterium]